MTEETGCANSTAGSWESLRMCALCQFTEWCVKFDDRRTQEKNVLTLVWMECTIVVGGRFTHTHSLCGVGISDGEIKARAELEPFSLIKELEPDFIKPAVQGILG